MVFDLSYATNSHFQVHPRMAEWHEVAGDGLTWTISLRGGQRCGELQPLVERVGPLPRLHFGECFDHVHAILDGKLTQRSR